MCKMLEFSDTHIQGTILAKQKWTFLKTFTQENSRNFLIETFCVGYNHLNTDANKSLGVAPDPTMAEEINASLSRSHKRRRWCMCNADAVIRRRRAKPCVTNNLGVRTTLSCVRCGAVDRCLALPQWRCQSNMKSRKYATAVGILTIRKSRCIHVRFCSRLWKA